MNKTLLINRVASELGNVQKKDVEQILNKTIEIITEEVTNGNKVSINGLGTFESVHKKARTGVNPLTGQKIYIQAKTVPKFKISKTFKDQVSEILI